MVEHTIASSPSGAPLLLTIMLGMSLVFFVLVAGMHLYQLLPGKNTNNFYLEARGRLMLAINLVLLTLITIVIVLRQILDDLNMDFPCEVSHLAGTLIFTSIFATYFIRTSVVLVAFRRRYRKRYSGLLKTKTQLWMWAGATGLGVVIWAALEPLKLCNSICTGRSCFISSNTYEWLAEFPLSCLILFSLARGLYNVPLDERLGLRTEVSRLLICIPPPVAAYMGLIFCKDFGLSSLTHWTWDYLSTALLLLAVLFMFIFSYVLPALRFQYSPFTDENAIRDSRETYLAMWKHAVLGLGGVTGQRMSISVSQVIPTTAVGPKLRHQPVDGMTLPDIISDPVLSNVLARYCRSCLCEELALFVIYMFDLRVAIGGETTHASVPSYLPCRGDPQAMYEFAVGPKEILLQSEIIRRFIEKGAEYEVKPPALASLPDIGPRVAKLRLAILKAWKHKRRRLRDPTAQGRSVGPQAEGTRWSRTSSGSSNGSLVGLAEETGIHSIMSPLAIWQNALVVPAEEAANGTPRTLPAPAVSLPGENHVALPIEEDVTTLLLQLDGIVRNIIEDTMLEGLKTSREYMRVTRKRRKSVGASIANAPSVVEATKLGQPQQGGENVYDPAGDSAGKTTAGTLGGECNQIEPNAEPSTSSWVNAPACNDLRSRSRTEESSTSSHT